MFNNARNVRIKDSSFYNIQYNTTNIITGKGGLEALHHRVATNAISNIGGRADDAKCHPGTRVEVIGLIERWIHARNGSSRMLWLSGPAGAGKTAIVKTVAERCKERGVHTANFFFFRGDSTRNHAMPLVATLVYQILLLYPAVHDTLANILSANPLVLRASVDEQFSELIHPLFDVIEKSPTANIRIVIVIDGLDECDMDADLDQARIIHALHTLATRRRSPCLVLIASRPEAQIQMAFNQLSSRVQTIFLDDQYSPEEDIRLFVNAEFQKIKSTHPSARSLPYDWPANSDIEDIVAKSSGQFIFSATVMRYIGNATTVPSLSLERVKGVVSSGKNSPFTHLDSIYAFILSRADDLETTRTVLSAKLVEGNALHYVSHVQLLCDYDSRYTKVVIESCVAELSAIVQLTESGDLKFYHASMADFLSTRSRSGIYWIDVDAFRAKVLEASWQTFSNDILMPMVLLSELQRPTLGITHMLLNRPLPEWIRLLPPKHIADASNIFLKSIYTLYYEDNVKTYRRIIRKFIYSWLSARERPDITGIPHARGYLLFYRGWFAFLDIFHKRERRERS